MANSEKSSSDAETILMALDQISQTIDVMNSVVGRLRNHMQQQKAADKDDQTKDLQVEIQSGRILH